MAIVNTKSTLFRGDAGAVLDPLVARGYRRTAIGKAVNAAGDSDGSKYLLAELPSHAILARGTLFHVENWGFAAIRIGTFATAGALVSVLKSAATTQAPVTALIETTGARLWQTMGLAADPGGVLGLYAHAIANATGAGDMPFVIEWIDNL